MRKTTKHARRLTVLTVWVVIGGSALQAQTAFPDWIYSTYLGGSNDDVGRSIAVDAMGNAFVAGETLSLDFPTWPLGVPGGTPIPDPRFVGDGFLTQFTPDGHQGDYSIYVGTASNDVVRGVAVSPNGTTFVVGTAFYIYDSSLAAGFVARIGPGPMPADVRFFVGGYARGWAVAADAAGNAYVTGSGFFHLNNLLFQQAVVVKLALDGEFLFYVSLIGMREQEGVAIAVDSEGNSYVTGYTRSPDFPAVNAADSSLGGSQDAFVTKLDPSGAIVYSTFLGGSGYEEGRSLALAPDGSLWVAGITTSADFPTLEAGQTSLRGPRDLFLTRLSPTGAIVSSTYLGGSGKEEIRGFDVDASGFLYLAGKSDSADFPPGGGLPAGCSGQFVSRLSPGFQLLASTCVPGTDVQDLAVDRTGTVYITGSTNGGLPVANAFQPQPAGGGDAFVVKLRLNHPPDCSAAFASPATLWPPNGRLVPVSIRGVTDPNGDPVTLRVTGVHQDEPLSRQGTPDALGIGTSTAQLRADRAGGGDGRVYRVTFEASDGNGGLCTGTVTVCVPHDQGRGRTCGDGGPLFPSGS